jgi:hypothetical protein
MPDEEERENGGVGVAGEDLLKGSIPLRVRLFKLQPGKYLVMREITPEEREMSRCMGDQSGVPGEESDSIVHSSRLVPIRKSIPIKFMKGKGDARPLQRAEVNTRANTEEYNRTSMSMS